MTDNIQKLYETAGVEPKPKYVYNKVPILSGLEYPPFTAEKQLELIKWLGKFPICIQELEGEYQILTEDNSESEWFSAFEQALADLVLKLYPYLTDYQKQEIKRILQ